MSEICSLLGIDPDRLEADPLSGYNNQKSRDLEVGDLEECHPIHKSVKSVKRNESKSPHLPATLSSSKTVKISDIFNISPDLYASYNRSPKEAQNEECSRNSQDFEDCQVNSFLGESLIISICSSSCCCCFCLPITLASVYYSASVEALLRKRLYALAARFVWYIYSSSIVLISYFYLYLGMQRKARSWH